MVIIIYTDRCGSDVDQLIGAGADADLFRMDQAGLPLSIRMIHVEVFVVRVLVAVLFHVAVKTAVLDDRHFVAEIHAGLVQGYRVKGRQHSHIGDDRDVIFGVAVTEGRNVADQGDMEGGAVLQRDCK